MKGASSKSPTGRTLLGKFPEGSPARARLSSPRAHRSTGRPTRRTPLRNPSKTLCASSSTRFPRQQCEFRHSFILRPGQHSF